MSRPKKDFINIGCKIVRPVAERLENFSKETGMSKTEAIERALQLYIDRWERTRVL